MSVNRNGDVIWDKVQLKSLFRLDATSCSPGINPSAGYLHHSIPAWDLIGGPVVELGCSIQSNKFLITKPCILVSKLNPRKPRVKVISAISDQMPVCASTEFMVYVPLNDKISLNFYGHYFASGHFQGLLERIATGTTNSHVRARPPETLRWIVPLPPVSEQVRIAEILDTADSTIERTEFLIAKLKTIKIGLLHDLLTRGLDVNGQLRDPVGHPELFRNEMPLGNIPSAWDVAPFNSVIRSIDAGKSFECPDNPVASGEWGVLKVSAIRPDGLRPEENKTVTNTAFINPSYEIRDNNLLISRANTYELVGLVCLVKNPPPKLLLCDKTLRLNLDDERALIEFIFYIMQMPFMRLQIEINATGTSGSMKNISQDTIRDLVIPLPEINEQKRIVAILHDHDAKLRAEEDYLKKLKQLKKGLMLDLLAGKVRVKPQELTA